MTEKPQEPRFEVVDETEPRPESRRDPSGNRRVFVLGGWRAKLLAAALLTAAAALLLTAGALLAAVAVVGGALLGAGWLARKAIFGGSPSKKTLGGKPGAVDKR